jgi:hypothetical protein
MAVVRGGHARVIQLVLQLEMQDQRLEVQKQSCSQIHCFHTKPMRKYCHDDVNKNYHGDFERRTVHQNRANNARSTCCTYKQAKILQK